LLTTLIYASSVLTYFSVSQENTEVHYALNAASQEALRAMQYDTEFMNCDDPADSVVDSFMDCVAKWGSWTLATSGKL
jgi:hypothetical protein